MAYDPVQERSDELRELEPRAATVDPWALLRELYEHASCVNPYNGPSRFSQALRKANEALKLHNERTGK